mmetsp:Transcript_129333/g.322411  ORF Transcript_129333/g.322411 Transcript_129333/m.322411 type:complete len:350 (+) Transcript_129333:73-1122(+)|eukprot:CAMPEP_0115253848 /NCGR_PEP_ID=MMETSP0270-20121206/44884_1 /TAXON_ID=71861 /ORGANISM="Scrippsiella trochoidea, Strain CCMP3099" /LENGTH=349 /DNA_ID=CAMNT_0002669367 /DNA_START=72 /DNA_END=1121 /DNA_ORIENTATION=-
MAFVERSLPTLLSSRPLASDDATKRRRPMPAALEFPEETVIGSVIGSPPGLDSPPGLRVKNTFIEGASLLSPSLEHFYQERAVHTCPSKHVGRFLGLLEELAADVPHAAATPLSVQTPCSIQTPLGDYPGYAHLGQLTGMLAGTLSTPTAAVVQNSRLTPASEQAGEVRKVLSLSDALEQEASSVHVGHLGLMPPPSLPSHPLSFGQLGTTAPQPSLPPQQSCLGFVSQQEACPIGASGQEPRASVMDFVPMYTAPTLEEITGACTPPSRPALGSLELPSAGSAAHAVGNCKPCAFVHTKGCENGLACQFCHLCGPEVKKARRQEKLQQRREAHRVKQDKQSVRQIRTA